MNKRDLFVVVADLDAENAIKTLLVNRQEALGVDLEFSPDKDLLRYSGRDSGCYCHAENLLRPPQKTHRRAIICFDRHGCGVSGKSFQEIEEDVESRLNKNGWLKGHASAIVIEPELEAWLWANSREVAEIIGWQGDILQLHNFLVSRNLWNKGESKPFDPKKAMKAAIREKGKGGGTAPLFAKLALKVGFRSCADPSFTKLRTTLQRWFPR